VGDPLLQTAVRLDDEFSHDVLNRFTALPSLRAKGEAIQ
jgi:hypothetical protein